MDRLHPLLAHLPAGLGPFEVLDVLIVGFILYQLLRLVRGTQASQLVVGMVLLGLLGVAAFRLDLEILEWVFQNSAPVIVIAVIVVFQPELRKMLDQLGRVARLGSPLASYNRQEFGHSVAEAIGAVERLSARNVGALIAFEREVGLEDYVESGIRLDSRLSADLLQTIFFPNSPLHDGAVIVRANKIVAAGCLLPLPEEGSVRERLGTRHRAAIGLSLLSDAMILVVSEETGGISVVENGTITRNLDPAGLRRRLTGRLDEARPSNGNRHIPGLQLPPRRRQHALAPGAAGGSTWRGAAGPAAPSRRVFEPGMRRPTRTPGFEPRRRA